jgi:hypothetical protein
MVEEWTGGYLYFNIYLMKKIYIYSLKNPITNEIRYVGKTINIKKRYSQHLVDKRQTHKRCWIDSLLKENIKPVIDILEICYEYNWEEREIYWINQYDNLTNHKKGGNGNSDYVRVTAEETKKKLSESRKKVILTEDWKNNIGNSVPCRRVLIDNLEYKSIMDASRKLNIPKSTIHKRLNSNNNENYLYC